MSAPSGPGDDAAIEEEAARAEVQRLTKMRGVELAAEILRAWQGSSARAGGLALAQVDIAAWLMRDHPGGRRLLPLLRSAVRDSCDLLVDAGLLEPAVAGYAVSSGGEVAGPTARLTLTLHGAGLVSNQWWFGESALSHLRDFVKQAHKKPRREPVDEWYETTGHHKDDEEPPEDWELYPDWPIAPPDQG